MSNVIITIARQYGSGGKTVGKMLAKELDIPYYDREIISMAAEESGVNPTLFQDEFKHHGLRALLSGGYKGSRLLSPESAGFTSDDNLFNYQAKIIKKLAETESCVIVGRCADYILRNYPNVMSVFVHAPHDFCMEQAMLRSSMTEREMEKFIAKTDKYRGEYYHYYTGQEWSSALHYDLCLDSSKLGFDKCVDAILAYRNIRFGED